jgi:hypothetical protein
LQEILDALELKQDMGPDNGGKHDLASAVHAELVDAGILGLLDPDAVRSLSEGVQQAEQASASRRKLAWHELRGAACGVLCAECWTVT